MFGFQKDTAVQASQLKKLCRRLLYSTDEELDRSQDALESSPTHSQQGTEQVGTHSPQLVHTSSSHANNLSEEGSDTPKSSGEETEQLPSVINQQVPSSRCPSPHSTHSGDAQSSSCSTSQYEGEWVISMVHEDTSPWCTDSDTLTPLCKRGRHEEQEQVGNRHAKQVTKLDLQAVAEIKANSYQLPAVPQWMLRNRQATVLLLADAQLHRWPIHDNKVRIVMRASWTLLQWIQVIQSTYVQVASYHKVIIYFELFSNVQVPAPLKNSIIALCRAIRTHNLESQIYICNLLPHQGGRSTVLGLTVTQANGHLFTATVSVGRRLGSIHLLSLHEHFVSPADPISPVHKYFREDGQLTRLGCLTFRECLFREAGMKTYWFGQQW